MAEEQYKPQDEYKFDESSGSSNVFGEGGGSKLVGAGSTAIRRYVLLGIGLVVVILAVYKLLGMFFTGKQVKPTTQATTTVVQPKTTSVSSQIAEAQAKQQASLLRERLQSLEAHNANTKTTMTNLVNSLAQLHTSIDKLDNKLNDLNNAMQTLSKEVNQQQTQIESIRSLVTSKPKKPRVRHVKRTRHKPVPHKVYYVQAIIPGRAWLKTKNGATLTVSEGSVLSGYGHVTIINPHEGSVATSSGRIIRYSGGDN